MTRITQIYTDFILCKLDIKIIICENPRYPRHLRSILFLLILPDLPWPLLPPAGKPSVW